MKKEKTEKILQTTGLTMAKYKMNRIQKNLIYRLLEELKPEIQQNIKDRAKLKKQVKQSEIAYNSLRESMQVNGICNSMAHDKELDKRKKRLSADMQLLEDLELAKYDTSRKFTFHVNDLARNPNTKTHEVAAALEKMKSMPIQYRYKTKTGEIYSSSTSILAAIDRKPGTPEFIIEVSSASLRYMVNTSQGYTSLQYAILMGFKSSYTQRVYELACHFADRGGLRMSLDEFKEIFCCESYNWQSVKQKVLDPSKKEMQETEGIDKNVEYAGEFEGRAVRWINLKIDNINRNPKGEIVINDADNTYQQTIKNFLLRLGYKTTEGSFIPDMLSLITKTGLHHTKKISGKIQVQLDKMKDAEEMKLPTTKLRKQYFYSRGIVFKILREDYGIHVKQDANKQDVVFIGDMDLYAEAQAGDRLTVKNEKRKKLTQQAQYDIDNTPDYANMLNQKFAHL